VVLKVMNSVVGQGNHWFNAQELPGPPRGY
jgi:hypothetical protein